MAEKEIKIGFSEAKLEALEFFLRENDNTVERSLKEYLDKVYEKTVPQQVRKFVESKIESEANAQGGISTEDGNRRANRRNARHERNREQRDSVMQADGNVNVQEQETMQEENAGMSMSM